MQKERQQNMRDPKRLNNFYDEFKKLHKQYFPDWRFGQLISNFFGWLSQYKGLDCFFPEEGKMIEYFREYATGETNNKAYSDEDDLK